MNSDQQFWEEFSKANEDHWCRALSQLLRYDTVSGDFEPKAHARWRQKIAEGFGFLQSLAQSQGFVTRNYENRVLVIEMPGPARSPVLGFPIHLDVVPAGEGWTRNPFGGEIAQGAIWGRGAQDDKGPIIQVLYALLGAVELAREVNRGFQRTVRIIIVSEEECGLWDDIPYYFSKESPPDFSIVPDAEFPITNGEKGIQNVRVDIGWLPIPEGLFGITAGERANVVPSKAVLKLGRALADKFAQSGRMEMELPKAPKPPTSSPSANGVEVLFHGIGCHGSLPHKGHNAASDALRAAAALPDLAGHPAGGGLDWLAQTSASLDGSFLKIDHRHEKVGKTTVNLGILRVDASGAHAVFNIRNPIGLPGTEVLARIRDSLKELAGKIEGITKATADVEPGNREPIYVDPDQFSQWIGPMKGAYQSVTGRESTLQSIGGTTFAKAFPNAVCFGPVDPNEEQELAHEADEHVTLAAMRRNIEIYGRAIAGIALE